MRTWRHCTRRRKNQAGEQSIEQCCDALCYTVLHLSDYSIGTLQHVCGCLVGQEDVRRAPRLDALHPLDGHGEDLRIGLGEGWPRTWVITIVRTSVSTTTIIIIIIIIIISSSLHQHQHHHHSVSSAASAASAASASSNSSAS